MANGVVYSSLWRGMNSSLSLWEMGKRTLRGFHTKRAMIYQGQWDRLTAFIPT